MNPLPVIGSEPTTAAMLRAFEQAQLEWCRALGDETQTSNCYLFSNEKYPLSSEANCLLGFAPAGVESIAEEFEAVVSTARLVTVNVSSSDAILASVKTYLTERAWQPRKFDLLTLNQVQNLPATAVGISFLPARSAIRQFEKLLTQFEPDDLEMHRLHLDDARYEPTVAMLGREPVGTIGLQSNGQTGVIRDLFVSPEYRRRGIGRALLAHALDASARSGHRLVMTAVETEPGFFTTAGFEKTGTWTAYLR